MLLHVGAYFFVFLSFLSHACLVYYFVVFQPVPVECFWEIKCWIWNGFNFVGLSAVCVVWRHMQPSLSWFCGWLKFWAGINIVYEIDGKWTKPSLTNNSKWKLANALPYIAASWQKSHSQAHALLCHWHTGRQLWQVMPRLFLMNVSGDASYHYSDATIAFVTSLYCI